MRNILVNPVECLSPDGLVIFLFHGVIEENKYSVRNYTNKHLEKDTFIKMLDDLVDYNKESVAMSMNDVIDYKKNNIPYPPYSYAITFDDGYENNYSIAAPILKQYTLPATFYITTDFIEYNSMSWTDELEYLLGGRGKRDFLDEIRRVRKEGETPKSNGPLYKKMDWWQVKELSLDSLFTIGGHSKSHKILSFIEYDEELVREILVCLEYIESRIGIRTKHFSYPEGQKNHYNADIINRLKRYGVECCPTAIAGVNTIEDDLFELKRINVV